MEDVLVGALLLSPEEYPTVAAIVKPADLLGEKARLVYDVMRFLVSDGKNIDPILISGELERRGELERLGGVVGLSRFTDAATTGENAKFYAESVVRSARERRIRQAVEKAHLALTEAGDVDTVTNELRADLKEAESSDIKRLNAKAIIEIAREQLDETVRRDFVSTGYRFLDECHGGGLARKSLTIIGAAPSVGKTQFVINLVPLMTYQDKPARILYVSMEMGEAEMLQRLTALMGGMHIRTAQTFFQATANRSTREQYGGSFERGLMALKGLPMRMITGSFTPDDLRALALRYSGQFDVMILDYVQRCKGEKGQQTRDRVEAATRACKDIAMEHDAAVIAIASLNRDGYKESGSKPDMQHLRESGNIEFDADNIWMLWRKKDTSLNVEDLELYIRKQRNGPLATLVYEFSLPTGSVLEKPADQQSFY